MTLNLDQVKIDLLRGPENWVDWKTAMVRLLKFKQVSHTISSDYKEKVPEKPQNECSVASMDAYDKKMKEYEHNDLGAQILISTSLQEDLRPMISSCTSAYEMWQKLLSSFERRSGQRLDMLYTKLFSYAKKESHKVAMHIDAVSSIGKEIKDEIGEMSAEQVINTIIVNRILNTLPEKYYEFKDTLTVEDMDLNKLTERLCLKEMSIESRDKNANEAFYANLHKANSHKNKTTNDKDKRKRNDSKNKIKCFGCNKYGHIAKDCPDETVRKNAAERQNKRNEKTEKKEEKPSKQANIAECFATEAMSCESTESSNKNQDNWFLDSGASCHMCYRREWFHNLKQLSIPGIVRVGNAQTVYALGKGDIMLRMDINGKKVERILCDVLYVPKLTKNLLSVSEITKRGSVCVYERNTCKIMRDGQVYAVGSCINGIYKMHVQVTKHDEDCEANVSEVVQLQTWHERLAHQNKKHVKKFLSLQDINFEDNDEFCEGCIYGKAHRSCYRSRLTKSAKVGEVISTDVCGPMQVESIGGSRYYVVFKDHYSKFCKVYFMKNKSEVTTKTRNFIKFAESTGHTIQSILSDQGKEFVNSEFKKLLADNGIIHRTSNAYCPEQNGSAERENRTLCEAARSMIHAKNLPIKLWAESIATAEYVLNRTAPTQVDDKTPYELWYGRRASISHLRAFGTECYVHIPKQLRRKWDNKAQKGIMVGYHGEYEGYRIYVKTDKNDNIVTSKDVTFLKEHNVRSSILRFPGPVQSVEPLPQETNVESDSETNSESDNEDEHMTQLQEDYHRNLRNRRMLKKPNYLREYAMDESYEEALIVTDELQSYEDVMKSPESAQWKCAMNEEMRSLADNKVWELVELPKDKKPIKNRWVFRIKHRADGSINRYKARLVAKGYSQKHGTDYFETFSPVARYDTVRSLLSVAAVQGLYIRQFDVATAFLHGDLYEQIYMEQPEGYDDGSGKVCLLKKSLYGLKQAPRCWNEKFTRTLERFNLIKSNSDPCLFVGSVNGCKLMVVIYVDDGLVLSSSNIVIEKFLKDLSMNFKTTTSEVSSFLGMQVTRCKDGSLFVNQPGYIERMLKKFGMYECKPVSTPIDKLNVQQERANDGKELTDAPYRQAIGNLMYLALATRPDIAYAVNYFAKHVEKPTEWHWIGVKRVFRYLAGTIKYGLKYCPKEDKLEIYSDADFATEADRKSISGILFKYGGSAVAWMSKKQSPIAQSTMEAELVASNEAARHAIWMRQLFEDIADHKETPVVFIDNKSTIQVIQNPEHYQSTKHIEIRYLFVKDAVEKRKIKVEYVSTNEQIADGLTKSLNRQAFVTNRKLLGLESM